MTSSRTLRFVAAFASIVLSLALFQGVASLAEEETATAAQQMAAVVTIPFAQ